MNKVNPTINSLASCSLIANSVFASRLLIDRVRSGLVVAGKWIKLCNLRSVRF